MCILFAVTPLCRCASMPVACYEIIIILHKILNLIKMKKRNLFAIIMLLAVSGLVISCF